MTSKHLLLLTAVVCLLCNINSYAQFQKDVFRPRNNAEVIGHNNNSKTLAWAGGLNNPQFAMADLNVDGKEDLVVYEQYAGVKTFISIGSGVYKYDRSYEDNFPEISTYLKLIDCNGDGIKDLIHRNVGIGVYYGYHSGNNLKFKFYKHLRYPGGIGGSSEAYVSPADIPGAADIDNDGDIDFVSYRVAGAEITYYKNCQKERFLPSDTIAICLKDNCWGKTFQRIWREHDLQTDCFTPVDTACKKPGRGQAKTTDGANTICLVDIDNDGDMDYFNGNSQYSEIQLLYNGRSDYSLDIDSIIAQDTVWSADNKQVHTPYYPAAFAIDYDNDQDIDLLFAPHSQNTENYKCALLYENIAGQGQKPDFKYRKDTFLVEEMIDVGVGSYPIFYDYNKDGKKDLFIGSDGYYQPSGDLVSRITYYRNESTSQVVRFVLVTTDFLSLSSLNIKGTALAVGDLDNDSLDDLVIGRSDGTFAFFKNNASTPNDTPKWQKTIDVMTDVSHGNVVLDVGDFAAPCIYDIDGDGKKDLVSGNQIGNVYYFNNYSTVNGFVGLKETTKNLGGINISPPPTSTYSFSAPYIGTMDDTQIDYLMIGTKWGEIYRFDSFWTANAVMLDSVYSYINVRSRATPAFANLDNSTDNLYEAVVGNELGGLTYYEQDFPAGVIDIEGRKVYVNIYPNPAKDNLHISWKNVADKNVYVKLISVTGQQIANKRFDSAAMSGSISLDNIPSGIYYAIVQIGISKTVRAVSILK